LKTKFTPLLAGIFLVFFSIASAGKELDPAQIRELKNWGKGFRDEMAKGVLTVIDSAGTSINKEFEFRLLEGTDKIGDKSWLKFTAPTQVKGITLLTHSYPDRAPDQWMFLPAFKMVKKVASSGEPESFAGSEFSTEDLMPFTPDLYTYDLQKEDRCGNTACLVIEAKNKAGFRSAYSKRIIWMDKNSGQIPLIEFFDPRGELIKKCEFSGYQLFMSRILRPRRMIMKNLKTSITSTIEIRDTKFATGLKASDFAPERLSR
jgi:outer membrane lipoprotein-sorting protein